MKKVLILAPYPAFKSPSQRYRFEHFLPYFAQHNLAYEYASFFDLKTWDIIFKKGHYLEKVFGTIKGFLNRIKLLFRVRHFDIVFIHREASPIGPPFFEWFIGCVLKKKIIFDFDDAVWLQEASENNKLISFIKWSKKTKFICRISHTISAGNQYLADFAGTFNNRVLINPTVVNTTGAHRGLKHHTADTQLCTIGWTGTFTTLPHLQTIIPVLLQLQQEIDFRFLVICNKDPQIALNHYEYIEWSEDREAADILKFDIGIMPLPDTEWAKGKCGFKAIQYMSLGIPAVVSDVGVNATIVDDGQNGFVCRTDPEWRSALKTLLADQALRIAMGLNARQKIENYYSVNAQTAAFFATFETE